MGDAFSLTDHICRLNGFSSGHSVGSRNAMPKMLASHPSVVQAQQAALESFHRHLAERGYAPRSQSPEPAAAEGDDFEADAVNNLAAAAAQVATARAETFQASQVATAT